MIHRVTLWCVVGAVVLACDPRIAQTGIAAQKASLDRATPHVDASQGRALLIGIDDYTASGLGRPRPSLPPRGWTNLHGAVNDVEAMREVLTVRYGFRPQDIVLLKNQQATRNAILQAIETHLEKPVRKDEVVLFYYSGHGSQVPNPGSTEPDKLDESIVPADSRLGAYDIRDKELRRAFNRILDRGARLTAILDTCHSGSGARGLATDRSWRAIRRDTRAVGDESDGPRPEARGALIISAAQDRELARETEDDDGRARGVFSWAWLRAMRRAEPGERAVDTFLRAQALIRAESPSQDPVLAGTAEARATPFLRAAGGGGADLVMAVEQVRPGGSVIVQGGWIHGLTVGSELRLVREDHDVRLEVTEMLGLGRSVAKVIAPKAFAPVLVPGALLRVAGWASPPARPLRVWMPRAPPSVALAAWADALERAAGARNLRWIDDPVERTPEYLLRWRDGAWELLDGEHSSRRFAAAVPPARLLEKIGSGSSLFVQLPAPAWLVDRVGVGPGTPYTAVEPAEHPEDADYVLTGRIRQGELEYAWIRPSMTAAEQPRTALPARTAWQSASKGADVALLLRKTVLRLRRLAAWQSLESPPDARWSYVLEVRRRADDTPVGDGVLTESEQYGLALRARPDVRPTPRYVYAFMIDSDGRSLLLYPRAETGSVENRFPLDARGSAPSQITLDTAFDVREPYGTDTYFMLTTDEPLPDPTILEWDGVRGRPATKTPLEDLLADTSSGSRAAALSRTPSNWSIDRLLFQCVPAKPKGP